MKVGDAFPAEDKGQVHHHYYHFERGCRPHRPYRLLRLILSILLIVFVVRLVNFARHAPMSIAPYGAPMPQALYGFAGIASAIVVLGLGLWLLRRRDKS